MQVVGSVSRQGKTINLAIVVSDVVAETVAEIDSVDDPNREALVNLGDCSFLLLGPGFSPRCLIPASC